MTAESQDDPFKEIVHHAGFTDSETQRLKDLEQLFTKLFADDGKVDPEAPVVLVMSRAQGERLLDVLNHAIGHGCEEGVSSTWAWLTQIVQPALRKRLEDK